MRFKKTDLKLNNLLFKSIILLIFLKLIFSYLTVENGWWLRHLPTNVDRFNFLGINPHFSNQLEYLIIPLSITYLTINFKHVKDFKTTIFLVFCMFFLNLLTSFYNGIGLISSFTHTLKITTPILVFIILIVHSKIEDVQLNNIMIKTLKLCLILVVIGLLFFNISMNREVQKWPIYFTGIHTHSYILASVFIALAYLLYIKNYTIYLFLFLFFSLTFLYFGYGVRSAVVFYLVFLITILFLKSNFFKYLWLQALIIIPFIVLTVFLVIESDKLNKFSSGRLEMYSTKFEILKDYNFLEILLGRGFKSDFITTDDWWWNEKGSHSDFLTFIIENGIMYLFLFLFLIFSLLPSIKKINIVFLSLIIGYLITSLISNGIAVRPLAAYVFFIVLAFVYNYISKSKISN
tara:strand:- start:110491 stop:111705 length:1215 start_codon:yes stop_codon:yes gene_type:complete